MRDERRENAVLDARQVCVEAIFEAGHGNSLANGPRGKDSIQQDLLMGFEFRPIGAVLFQNEVVVLIVDETQHAVFLMLFDHQVAAHGEINNGCGNVAHVGGVINERAGFARRELLRGLILRGDRTQARVAALGPPEIKHDDENDDRQTERPIAPQEERRFVQGRRLVDEAYVERHGNRQAFVIAKRLPRAYLHAVAQDLRVGFLRA